MLRLFRVLRPLLIFFGVMCVWSLVTQVYPDYLWFQSFGYVSQWLMVFKYKAAVFGLFFTFFAAWFGVHGWLCAKFSKGVAGASDPIFSRFRFLNQVLNQWGISARSSKVFPVFTVFILCLVVSGIMAFRLMGHWQTFLMALYAQPFGLQEPIFNRDVAFYTMVLPAWQLLKNALGLACFLSLLGVGWLYITRCHIYLFVSRETRFARMHLGVLLGLGALWLAAHFGLAGFDLLLSKNGVVFGIGYTDAHAQLWGYRLLMGVSIGAAMAAVLWGVLGRLPLLVGGVAAIVISVVGLLGVWPQMMQSYSVKPNELQKERPYLRHNILYTRKAYQLDRIQAEEFPANQKLTFSDIQNNQGIVRNIRLWNEAPLKQTFAQLQEIRPYYTFDHIDVDRYRINGHLQQVLLSPRELDTTQLPAQAQTWTNKHLVYTHGYGLCMSPVNEISQEGLPYFYIKDFPPTSNQGFLTPVPQIYFGETTRDYAVVNTGQPEFDYPKGDANVYTNYTGRGGILLDSWLKKAALSLRLSDINLVISPLITEKSRVLMDRDIRTMVKKLTPFIEYDADPYLVSTEKGLFWILDGYTMSDKFPYSEPYKDQVNYIRNAVKAVVNAYDGQTRFYVSDDQDPLIGTLSRIYAGMFLPFKILPEELKAHLRYPKALFRVQATMYSTYHMTDPQVFYNREDVWSLPKRSGEEESIQAQYTVTKIPGENQESFVLMVPFTPVNKNNMIAWLGAECGPENYGRLKVFKFSKSRTLYGPNQIESRIDQDTEISQKLTLWGQVGSRVIRGDLLVIPIENSVMYVQPIYLQSTQGKFPELKRVIFAYGDDIIMAETLPGAIETLFRGRPQEKSDSDLKPAESQTKMQKLVQAFQGLKAQLETVERLIKAL